MICIASAKVNKCCDPTSLELDFPLASSCMRMVLAGMGRSKDLAVSHSPRIHARRGIAVDQFEDGFANLVCTIGFAGWRAAAQNGYAGFSAGVLGSIGKERASAHEHATLEDGGRVAGVQRLLARFYRGAKNFRAVARVVTDMPG